MNPNIEVKWSHYGSALKNNYGKIPHCMTPNQLKDYYAQSLSLLCSLKSATIYYTLTENNSIGKVNEIKFLKMHLQNVYQRVQTTVAEKNGFAIVVADDLNNKTKALKEAVYELTLSGDYVQYTNIKKGLYIDFSDQCHGLQIADICAGIFTASLKYESTPTGEKHKYECGHKLFFTYAYKKTRNHSFNAPYYEYLSILQAKDAAQGQDSSGFDYPKLLENVRSVIAANHSQELSSALGSAAAAQTLKMLILKYCVHAFRSWL
ncbi:MAG: DUF3800 domain-containing protein [Syntrophomonadaceae bacterium]|nr:DUF3800 domain-containing protein [Syntrophomonadaceae bacterium]